MRESISPVRLGWFLLGIAGMIALSGVAPAEQVGAVKELETNWRNTDKERREYMQATKKVEDKKLAEKVAQSCAQYYIYRITHPAPKAQVQKDFADMIGMGEKRGETNIVFVNILGPKMVEAMKEVLRAQDPKKDAAVTVNAAMMLPAMARLKQDDVGDYLVELINAKDTPDYVRLYALRALKEYMPITVQPGKVNLDLKKGKQSDKRVRDQRHIESLTYYIGGPVKIGWLSQVKIGWLMQGDIKAKRYLRREAILSLAQVGSPAVLAVPENIGKKKTPDGMVAPTLLKVLMKGELQPPPSLQEKVEAAIGLLNMNYPNMPEYNPDVATYLVGKTLLEFATEYSGDRTNFGKKLPYLPWKADAKRLKDGVEKHAKNADTNAAKALKTFGDKGNLLDRIIAYEAVNVNELSGQVEKWRPKDGKVFKTLTAPEIRLTAPVDPD